MASQQEKQRITKLLQKVVLSVCEKVVPFKQALELHGVLLLETDDTEFCTVSFKDIKLENNNVESEGGQQNSHEGPVGGRSNSNGMLEEGLESNSHFDVEESGQSNSTEAYNGFVNEIMDSSFVNSGVAQITNSKKKKKQISIDENRNENINPVMVEKFLAAREKQKELWKNQMWTLERNSNGKFQCVLCLREFSHATNLTRHQRSSHGRPLKRTGRKHNHGNKHQKEHPNSEKITSKHQIKHSNVGNTAELTNTEPGADNDNHYHHHVDNGDDLPDSSDEIETETETQHSDTDHHVEIVGETETNFEANFPEDNENKRRSTISDQHPGETSDDLNQITREIHNPADTAIRNPPLFAKDFQAESPVYPTAASFDPGLLESGDNFEANDQSNVETFGPSSFSARSNLYIIEPQPIPDHDTRTKHKKSSNDDIFSTATGIAGSDVDLNPNDHGIEDSSEETISYTDTIYHSAPQVSDSVASAPFKDLPAMNPAPESEYISLETVDNAVGKHSCPICQRDFDFYQNLGRHAKVAHSISIFELEKQFPQLVSHRSESRSGKKKKPTCDICGHTFSFASNLSRHRALHHQGATKAKRGRKRTNQQPEINKTKQAADSRKNTEKQKTKQKGTSKTTARKSEPLTQASERVPSHNGDGSDNPTEKTTPTIQDHTGKSHNKGRNDTGRYKCFLCNVSFSFSSSLARHLRQKHKLVRAEAYRKANPQNSESVTIPSKQKDSGLEITHSSKKGNQKAGNKEKGKSSTNQKPWHGQLHGMPTNQRQDNKFDGGSTNENNRNKRFILSVTNQNGAQKVLGTISANQSVAHEQTGMIPANQNDSQLELLAGVGGGGDESVSLSAVIDECMSLDNRHDAPQVNTTRTSISTNHSTETFRQNSALNRETVLDVLPQKLPPASQLLPPSIYHFPAQNIPQPVSSARTINPFHMPLHTLPLPTKGVPSPPKQPRVEAGDSSLHTHQGREDSQHAHQGKDCSPSTHQGDASLARSSPNKKSDKRKSSDTHSNKEKQSKLTKETGSPSTTSPVLSPSEQSTTPPGEKTKKKSRRSESSSPKKAEKSPHTSSPDSRHKCSICLKVFTFRTNLTRHLKKVHGTIPDISTDGVNISP